MESWFSSHPTEQLAGKVAAQANYLQVLVILLEKKSTTSFQVNISIRLETCPAGATWTSDDDVPPIGSEYRELLQKYYIFHSSPPLSLCLEFPSKYVSGSKFLSTFPVEELQV
jgi:hypothetical protein